MEKTPTLPSAGSATNRRSPLGEIAMERGWDPTAITKGDPLTAPKLPFLGSMVKAEMSPDPWLATYKNGAAGEMAMAIGPVPVFKMVACVGGGMGGALA